MRGKIYLLSLVLAVAGAVYFASEGRPVVAVLAVVPGYFVVAYVLILISTFLPGKEKRRYLQARAAAFPTSNLPRDTAMHPAFLGSIFQTMYSGDGFLGWPEGGDLHFLATVLPPTTFQYPPRAFRGFKIETTVPPLITGSGSITADGGPVVLLDGGTGAGMAHLWVQPGDADAFAERLRSAGVPALD